MMRILTQKMLGAQAEQAIRFSLLAFSQPGPGTAEIFSHHRQDDFGSPVGRVLRRARCEAWGT